MYSAKPFHSLPNNQEVSLNVCVGRQPSCEVVTIAATERGRKGGMQHNTMLILCIDTGFGPKWNAGSSLGSFSLIFSNSISGVQPR